MQPSKADIEAWNMRVAEVYRKHALEVQRRLLTVRGDSTAPISAEYECPVHGRFMVTVPRPSPDSVTCPREVGTPSFIDCTDPECPAHDHRHLVNTLCGQESPWRFPTPKPSQSQSSQKPIEPLDVEYDGVKLRTLIDGDAFNRQERGRGVWKAKAMTSVQRAAVSAHWSAQLRAKVAASKAADTTQVLMPLDAEDCEW